MHLLVVEDDPLIQKLLSRGLTSDGFVVDVAGTGEEGLDRALSGEYDAMILDVTLPDTDGFQIARRARSEGIEMPILMLTGRGELDDRLEGFASGADDYLVKPFAFQELLVRVHAVMRRTGPPMEKHLQVSDLVLDRRTHEVTRAGRPIKLSPKEFMVLEFLMEHAGQALSRTVIVERVWEYSYEGFSNVVETSIKRLRKAVDSGHEEKLIQTVYGVGYKIKTGS
jgi:two-component system copper resistance phosphate regulon response regulator CusR